MGLSTFAKSQLSYSIPDSMLRLNKFEKIVPKMGKMWNLAPGNIKNMLSPVKLKRNQKLERQKPSM